MNLEYEVRKPNLVPYFNNAQKLKDQFTVIEFSSPSITAVVMSQNWSQITKYAGLVCAQTYCEA